MLLRHIERHLRTHPISATRFGREATRDPRFVHDLRQGRQPGARIAARVSAYMAKIDGGAAS